MKIAVSSDNHQAPLVKKVIDYIHQCGHEAVCFGISESQTSLPWPTAAHKVATVVAEKKCDQGIILCWSGTGVSIAANKTPGIRAALCGDAKTAEGARLWNNANVLCLSIRSTSLNVAEEIMKAWFETNYKPNPDDDTCLKLLEEIENRTT